MRFPPNILLFFVSCATAFAHGRSEELTRLLNSPVPEWLSIASPIKLNPSSEQGVDINESNFRDKSGGATNSRTRVYIPGKNLIHQFNYNMVWTGGSNKGIGVSLSPDGSKLLTNTTTTPYIHLYNITQSNELQEMDIQLPRITYDKGLKGFISLWHWASNEVLVGRAAITDERGHELVESRIYAYNLKTKSLARLDLSSLDLDRDDPPVVEVVSIGKDLSELILDVGGHRVLAKADLQSPHKLIKKDNLPKRSDGIESPRAERKLPSSQTSEKEAQTKEVNEKSNLPWIVAGVLLVGSLLLLIKKSGPRPEL